jgi:mRNA interferase HigB
VGGGEDRVRIITESRLTAFWKVHPPAEAALRSWRGIMRRTAFESPHEVKAQFPSVDFLGDGITVFNIAGNKYRLVVAMQYVLQRVYVRHVLTHAEYDRLCKSGDL